MASILASRTSTQELSRSLTQVREREVTRTSAEFNPVLAEALGKEIHANPTKPLEENIAAVRKRVEAGELNLESAQDAQQGSRVSDLAQEFLRDYLLARARMIANGATYVEELDEQELADLCAMSRRKFPPFSEWIKRRFPE